MLTELCQELRNWFEISKHPGEYRIEGGVINAPFLQTGQYYRIVGSVFNDGVFQFGAEDPPLTDESFSGSVWALAIPREVLDLAEKISAWQEKYEAADSPALSPFSSESFGGYSYSKGVATSGDGSGGSGWRAVFGAALKNWRKL